MNTELLQLARQPWTLRLGAVPTLIRPAAQCDLPAIAQMQRRCTARTLLDRYRLGGRPPSTAVLDAEVRSPYAFVAMTPGDKVIAVGSLSRDPQHEESSARLDLLVESKWQQHGLGAELASHLAGVAHAADFTELIAYPATALEAGRRLMTGIGRTRMVPGAEAHMHTYLHESVGLGLGPVRQKLAA